MNNIIDFFGYAAEKTFPITIDYFIETKLRCIFTENSHCLIHTTDKTSYLYALVKSKQAFN